MKEIVKDNNLVAFCGLYCGACGKYLKEVCLGCKGNDKASWCQVRKCCLENNYLSCADCKDFAEVTECKKFNNFMSKIFAFFFRSDRKACIGLIKEAGYDKFAEQRAAQKTMTIKK